MHFLFILWKPNPHVSTKQNMKQHVNMQPQTRTQSLYLFRFLRDMLLCFEWNDCHLFVAMKGSSLKTATSVNMTVLNIEKQHPSKKNAQSIWIMIIYTLFIHSLYIIYTLFIHYLYTIYTLFIHYLYTIYTLFIHYLYNIYTLFIHYLYIIYTLFIHYLYIIYTLFIHYLYIIYTLFIHYLYIIYTLFIHYLYIIYTLFIHYLYIIYTLFIHYLYIIYTIFIHCLYIIYTLFIHYLYIIYTLFIHIFYLISIFSTFQTLPKFKIQRINGSLEFNISWISSARSKQCKVSEFRATQRILRGVLVQLQVQKMVEMTRLQRALHLYLRQWHQPPPLHWEDMRR